MNWKTQYMWAVNVVFQKAQLQKERDGAKGDYWVAELFLILNDLFVLDQFQIYREVAKNKQKKQSKQTNKQRNGPVPNIVNILYYLDISIKTQKSTLVHYY